MREFVSKTKKMRVTIDGSSYEMRCPSIAEAEELNESLKGLEGAEVTKAYLAFFGKLGLKQEVILQMDQDDFIEFIKFVLNPNYKGSQPTQ